MRIMGLDFGENTIGVAISDPMGWTAQGIETIRRQGWNDGDMCRLKQLIKEWEVEKIVIGLPKNMNGTLGPRAEKTLEFKSRLEEETGLPVITWDERLSTKAAERALLEADVSRGKRKKVIDKLAAVIILQGYLDGAGMPAKS
ncbi:MAG TPA: Holliday junction resolvase RuvX [Bacillota bacterium]|nr:Holliday junction resolvase RuvX [Bacillota bacterium]